MSHQIETFTSPTGVPGAAFASARLDAWHQLGTVTADCMTAADVMVKAHLGGWNVRKIELHATELTAEGVTTLDVPDRLATVRTNPRTGETEYLGVVGTGWTPVQNEETTDLLDAITDQSGAHFETAGSLNGGRHTFVTMKLPDTMRIGDVDDLALYLACLNGHDGTKALRVLATPTRIVCANTQAVALNTAKTQIALRHTSGATNRVAEIRDGLGLLFKGFEVFEAEANKMINEPYSNGEFDRLIAAMWPKPDQDASPRSVTIHRNRATSLRRLFRDADTQAKIRNTRWGAYQAIVEHLDHGGPASPNKRAERVLTSSAYATTKATAWNLLTV